MSFLIVIENTRRWPLHVPGSEVVSAREYLMNPRLAERRNIRVFNLCRTYGYQQLGYYVSLLAAARGHRPLPSVETIQDLRISPLVRLFSKDFDDLIQWSLAPLRSSTFELSIYFGRNLARRYDRLSLALFSQFPAPFLRASFARDGRWLLQNLRLIATSEIPDAHRDFVIDCARSYFTRPGRHRRPRAPARFDLAILAQPDAEDAPSNERALRRFARAAESLGIDTTRIDRSHYGRLAEFDALFIRETTSVNHHTYRFSRRASAEGLVVVDDPESIVRCTNKVYQAELFERHGIPMPRTMIAHAGNLGEVARGIGFPCVLKLPDSSFSRGVIKLEDEAELRTHLAGMLAESDLAIAQEFVASGFDWRIGILEGRALYACRYHMAPGHWQIVDRRHGERFRYGKVETIPVEEAPAQVIAMAEASSRLIGTGLYGVDIKEVNGRCLLMEVNDNPNIDAGYEDAVLGEELYLHIMRWFLQRMESRGAKATA